jgi:ketosteroid isomerase-like protein
MNDGKLGPMPAPADNELAEFRKATRALYDLKERAFAAADADLVVESFYAEDAVSVGPDGKSIEGREAFRAAYRSMVKDKTVRIESWNSYVRGDAGWDWTNFHIIPNSASRAPSTAIILFIWSRGGQGWVCAGDMVIPGERPIGEGGR